MNRYVGMPLYQKQRQDDYFSQRNILLALSYISATDYQCCETNNYRLDLIYNYVCYDSKFTINEVEFFSCFSH